MKQKLEIRLENDFCVGTGDFGTFFCLCWPLAWLGEVCMGEWQEVSLTLMVLEDLLSASSKAGTRSHLQEPGEGDGSSCPPGEAISAGGHMTALAQRRGPKERGEGGRFWL